MSNTSATEILTPQGLALPGVFYDSTRSVYWIPNDRGGWIPVTETGLRRYLRELGISGKCLEIENLSPLEKMLLNIQRKNDVIYAGSLAGYFPGFSELCGQRILITTSPKLIIPKFGEFPLLNQFFSGLLITLAKDQRPYLFGWLKVAFECLKKSLKMPGQALVLAGERNCGKSLLQSLITVILGGRSAKPYRYMSGATQFNGDLFCAEHLMIEDESASTDIRTRRKFGAEIKNITVNQVQSCHGKNKQALSLEPFWRLTVTLNNEPENLMILPPLDESLADKIILLKAEKNPLPLPTNTQADRANLWNQFLSELPAFLDYLENWEIPAEIQSNRFGMIHYHHPELLEALEILSPEVRLLSIIDSEFFTGPDDVIWRGTAEELESQLIKSRFASEAQKLFSWNNACGTYLGRLASRHPERIICQRTSSQRIWRIRAPSR